MADMEDLFGSDADSDAERKGGVAWASLEGRAAGLGRPDPDRRPVPGLRAPRRYVRRVALPPLQPQRPLRPGRCQPPCAVPAFPQRAGAAGRAESVRLGVRGVPGACGALGAGGARGARGRGGGAAPRGPAPTCLAQVRAGEGLFVSGWKLGDREQEARAGDLTEGLMVPF